jgi:hypothetical protein
MEVPLRLAAWVEFVIQKLHSRVDRFRQVPMCKLALKLLGLQYGLVLQPLAVGGWSRELQRVGARDNTLR